MRSLWIKVLAGFMLVAIVAVGVVALLANRALTQQFRIYVSQGRQQRAEWLAPEFAAYYALTGSWEGVNEWAAAISQSQAGTPGQGQGRGRGRLGGSDRLLLADADGYVLADTDGALLGQRLSSRDLKAGAPIEVDGQLVGTLFIPAAEGVHQAPEVEFLRQVNNWLLWAGLAAGVVALILGLVLARQLTAPLRRLTDAAQQLAGGEVAKSSKGAVPQVPVRSRDEVGQLSQAFNKMAQSLSQQETLRRNMMADIAHELRTPLTVIRSDLEALLDGVYDPSPEALASLYEETLLLTRLVDDLRALAQAEAGQLRLERQPTDLNDLLLAVVASYEPHASAQGQTLSLDPGSALTLVDADPQRVRQIVTNLVSNALRHAPQGGEVTIAVDAQAREALVSVSDDGPGITPENIAHVFDRFWQGDSARAGSSGLGLAIARELVLAHGGQIWVESEPGKGATFHFALPLFESGNQS
jgi:two-component system OmpR family sensor kinase/two-component system sensor histidine kinase BaeS